MRPLDAHLVCACCGEQNGPADAPLNRIHVDNFGIARCAACGASAPVQLLQKETVRDGSAH
jgi:translation initiation factor 2 beta subunit (eIF-2beta)/eIF-5